MFYWQVCFFNGAYGFLLAVRVSLVYFWFLMVVMGFYKRLCVLNDDHRFVLAIMFFYCRLWVACRSVTSHDNSSFCRKKHDECHM